VPGRWREPYGLVVAEAALSGLPVLISRPSTLAAKVEELQIGAVFDPHLKSGLAQRLQVWAGDDETVRRMSCNAAPRASQICTSPEGWAQQFIELMEAKLQTSVTDPE
jgi:glycosyltransferase involved in cell wall biosynthesis